MEFTVKSGNPEKQRSACVVVGVFEPRRLSPAAEQLDQASEGLISNLVRRGDMEGKPGQTLMLFSLPNTLCDRVLLVGCGREREFDLRQFRRAVTTAVGTLDDGGSMEAVCCLTELPLKGHDVASRVTQAVLAADGALYRSDQLKSKKTEQRRPLRKLILSIPSRRELAECEEAVRIGQGIAAGAALAKELGNLPGNICTPTYLAEQARQLGRQRKKLKVEVLEQADMEKLGMGALLSVARGSRQPPKLIVMQYRGGAKDDKPVAFVGKGLTFDAGGISIKPAQAMDEMKYDMCGAAAVLGAMRACVELDLPVNLVGVIPSSENLPDGDANKPGDIVTSMSGQTVEVLNTDAEGRLILCDALTYTERFEPTAVVDLATLTGACVIALGNHAHGLMTNHKPLAHDLLNAGKTIGDQAWELPLWDEYQEQLDSNFADMANIGGREAGAITAGCFLSRFTKKFRWAHLDIAGTAWVSGKSKGATGRPVGLLVQFLLDRIAANRAKEDG
jgi:leucyl aminopeptidase